MCIKMNQNDAKRHWEKFSKCPRHDAWIEIVEYVKNELQNYLGDDLVETEDTGK